MKKILILMSVVFALCGCDKRLPVAKAESSNGWKVGACYQMVSPNPFDEDPVIMRITGTSGEWMQYQFYLGKYTGYGRKRSEKINRYEVDGSYKEVPCPDVFLEY